MAMTRRPVNGRRVPVTWFSSGRSVDRPLEPAQKLVATLNRVVQRLLCADITGQPRNALYQAALARKATQADADTDEAD